MINDEPKIEINSPNFIIELIKHIERNLNSNLQDTYKSCTKESKATNDRQDCIGCANDFFWNNKNLVYDCNNRNLIYAIRTMPCHAEEIYMCFYLKDHHKKSILLNFIKGIEKMNIASIGYGCGTDLLAILQLINKINNTPNTNHILSKLQELNLLKIDNQKDHWQESAEKVLKFIEDKAEVKDGLKYKIFEHEEYETLFNGQIDIFILSYILNELDYKQEKNIFEVIKKLASDHFFIIAIDCKPIKDHENYFDSLLGVSKNRSHHDYNNKRNDLIQRENSIHTPPPTENIYVSFKPAVDQNNFQKKYHMKTKKKSYCYIYEYKFKVFPEDDY